jgi:hypothetical protein
VTPRQYKSLARYIHAISKEFGLNDWDLRLHTDPPEDSNALAAVSTVYGRKIAHIYVCEDFDHFEPEQQRIAIIHELTHIHQAQVFDLIDNTLPDALGKHAFAMFEAGWRQAMEHTTDAIATAIAPMFPLWMP